MPFEHPQMLSFFNGAHDLLIAAFAAGDRLSDETKGNAREGIVLDVLRNLMPPMARIEPGDIIDSEGRQSGQLDAVILDERSPTLKLVPHGHGFVLAEGVVGVVDIKSNLCKQWSQVERTFEQLVPLRPSPSGTRFDGGAIQHGAIFPPIVPFFVLGLESWATDHTMLEKLRGLAARAHGIGPAFLLAVSLKPARFALVAPDAPDGGREEVCPDEKRGLPLWILWANASKRAREVAYRDIPFASYGRGEPPALPAAPPIQVPTMLRIPNPLDE